MECLFYVEHLSGECVLAVEGFNDEREARSYIQHDILPYMQAGDTVRIVEAE